MISRTAIRVNAPAVVIVNEKLAKAFWPKGDAVGKRLTLDDPRKNPVWLTVVGVARNVKQWELDRRAGLRSLSRVSAKQDSAGKYASLVILHDAGSSDFR